MRAQGNGTVRGRVMVVKPLGCARTFDGIRRNGLAPGAERHSHCAASHADRRRKTGSFEVRPWKICVIILPERDRSIVVFLKQGSAENSGIDTTVFKIPQKFINITRNISRIFVRQLETLD
jgi:hypothetical protein